MCELWFFEASLTQHTVVLLKRTSTYIAKHSEKQFNKVQKVGYRQFMWVEEQEVLSPGQWLNGRNNRDEIKNEAFRKVWRCFNLYVWSTLKFRNAYL